MSYDLSCLEKPQNTLMFRRQRPSCDPVTLPQCSEAERGGSGRNGTVWIRCRPADVFLRQRGTFTAPTGRACVRVKSKAPFTLDNVEHSQLLQVGPAPRKV